MLAQPVHYRGIVVRDISPGVVEVTIQVPSYGSAGVHWREQLSGPNAKKWGRLYIDPDQNACKERRRSNLWSFGRLYRGEGGANLDEVPGAMFVCETQEPSHVKPVAAADNQALGRDLYWALRTAIQGPMGWFEVRFRFADGQGGLPSGALGMHDGRYIDTSALRPGDIIVSRSSGEFSKLIRRATNSDVSHAMIYTGDGRVVEAVLTGVVNRPLSAALAGATYAAAYRHVKATPTAGRLAVGYALQQVGKRYDVSGLIGQGGYQLDRWFLCTVQQVPACDLIAEKANLWMESNNRFFCSELVANAFQHAGIPLVPNVRPAKISPQTIVEVGLAGTLIYLGQLKP